MGATRAPNVFSRLSFKLPTNVRCTCRRSCTRCKNVLYRNNRILATTDKTYKKYIRLWLIIAVKNYSQYAINYNERQFFLQSVSMIYVISKNNAFDETKNSRIYNFFGYPTVALNRRFSKSRFYDIFIDRVFGASARAISKNALYCFISIVAKKGYLRRQKYAK